MVLPPDDECIPELLPSSDDEDECLPEVLPSDDGSDDECCEDDDDKLPSSDDGECRAIELRNRLQAVASGHFWRDPMPDECCSRN